MFGRGFGLLRVYFIFYCMNHDGFGGAGSRVGKGGGRGGNRPVPGSGRTHVSSLFLRLLSAADGSAGLPRCLFSAALRIKPLYINLLLLGMVCCVLRQGWVVSCVVRSEEDMGSQSRAASLCPGRALTEGWRPGAVFFFSGSSVNLPRWLRGAQLVGRGAHRYLRRFNT